MRRLKAIYLVPVFLVLLIGAAAAAYYFLFKPQMELVDKARKEWEAAQQACAQEESGYQQAYNDMQDAAKKIIYDYYKFRGMQNAMPAIYNIKEMPGDDRTKLRNWYYTMGSGALIRELTRWARSFHLPNTPKFTYSGMMGYEDTLPTAKLVSVDFGDQKYEKRGFVNLTNAIRRTVGYGYFPLVIDVGETVTVKVNRNIESHNPKNPLLSMNYKATAYFFTRGWNPLGPTAQDEINKLMPTAVNPPPTADQHRMEWTNGECPTVLWIFTQEGLKM